MTSITETRAHALATYRWIHVRLMETLAAWVPTTPEMEAKLLLGEHIWQVARIADALGKRTRELRAPLHDEREPAAPFRALLTELAEREATGERLSGLYRVVLPALSAEYGRYVRETDSLLDAPSVRLLEDAQRELARMETELDALVAELERPDLGTSAWADGLSARCASLGPIVDAPRAAEATAPRA